MTSFHMAAKPWLCGALAGLFVVACGAQAAEVRSITELPETATRATASRDLPVYLPRALGLDAQSSYTVRHRRPLPNNHGETVRLDQTYRGVPILDQEIVVQVSPSSEIGYIRGTAVFDIGGGAAAPAPKLTSAAALDIAKAAVSRRLAGPFRLAYRSVDSRLYYQAGGSTLRLVYRVTFYTDLRDAAGHLTPTRPVYLIDANSGDVLSVRENLQNDALGQGPGGNTKTGLMTWGSSAALPKFQVTPDGTNTNCTMDDGAHVFAEDVMHGTDMSGETGTKTPFSFSCFTNTYQAINGGNSPLNDAQSFGYALYKMYKTWYGIAPITQKLWLRVHYGTTYENAFWNGDSMAFGDGHNTFYPLVGLDVTGHEISHGFTEQNSNLTYEKQSGGMNEAYSDMAGEALEYFYANKYGDLYSRGSIAAYPDFKVGAEIYKAANQALRYMCTPPDDGASIDMAKDFYVPYDVHLTSGVYNKAFCLLATTTGWDAKKAFDVFEGANRNFWTANESYRSGVDGTVQAATTLGYSVADVKTAFKTVGIVTMPTVKNNDNFAKASLVKAGWKTVLGSNVGATSETGEPVIVHGGGKSVWFKCRATTTGSVTVDTIGSNVDTELGVYTGTAVSSLVSSGTSGDINGNDPDHGGNYASRVTFSAAAGTVYSIGVDGYSNTQSLPKPASDTDTGEIWLNFTGGGCAGDRHDFNADGISDILWHTTAGGVSVSQLDGASVTSTVSAGSMTTAWSVAGVGDFDGDGKADILWRNTNGDAEIWEMNGAVKKLTKAIASLPSVWQVVAVADFDGDGKADIAWRNKNTGVVQVWLMNGTTVTSKANVGTMATSFAAAGTADVDGDGKADIIWYNKNNGKVTIWQMEDGKLRDSQNVGTKTGAAIVGTGDFNGDGKDDILWQNANGTLSLWQMDGFTMSNTDFAGRANSTVAAVRDFTGDGKADILWRSTTHAVLWPMNGATAASEIVLISKPASWKIQP